MESQEIRMRFPFEGWVPVIPGSCIEIRARAERVEKVTLPGGTATLESAMQFSRSARQFVMTSLHLVADDPEHDGLTARALREIQVAEMVSKSADHCVRSTYEGAAHWVEYWLDDPKPAAGRDRAEVMRDAAHIWALAHLTGRPENATVAAYLDVSVSTAKRYLLEPEGMNPLVEFILGSYGDDQ